MSAIVGILLIAIAASTIVGVLYVVMREQHVHEEYYIPQPKPPAPEAKPVTEVAAEKPASEPASDQPEPTA